MSVISPAAPERALSRIIRRIRRAIWRPVLLWRFRLFQRHRHDRLVVESTAGCSIIVLPQVFNPTLFQSSEFFIRSFNPGLIPRGSVVLDMGTGSGLGAIVVARWADRVTAIDINPEAVRCARINALLNHVDDRVEVIEGDLFAPIGDRRFDVVLFNPPFFRGAPRSALDRAWRSSDVVERFAAGLRTHLTPRGYALVILSTEGDADNFLNAFRANGFAVELVAQRDVIVEVLTIYQIR
jgi:HemK-related putative methylase